MRAPWRNIDPMNGEAATREQTIEAFLTRSKRQGTVGIRMSFLQPGRGLKAGKGVLASFVGGRDELALDLYLLLILLGRGSRLGKHFVDVQSGVWSRVLGLTGKSANQVLSRALGRLERRKLVRRVKTKRGVRVQLLREDGQGGDYSPPTPREFYFQLPFAYWRDNHYLKLRMPGKAMLLVALGEQWEFELPVARVPAWYGISSETADRGYEELVRAGIAEFDQRTETAVWENPGRRIVKRWRLCGPYVREEPPAKPVVAPLRRVK
jgi:hypothetical protein